MKSYTDIEQSKKLAKVLPADSADMWWPYYYDVLSDSGEYDKEPTLHKPIIDIDHAIPCWSLATLLETLNNPGLMRVARGNEKGNWFLLLYSDNEIYRIWGNNPIDICYELILKLHKQKRI